ncbi:MAG: response regulator [Sedimentisphaerales bacterium]|nr:response regulator [Sedimentisphaerales bacterium]MBN2841901.1 response regulator [Sedimentisphaerales bacterium]
MSEFVGKDVLLVDDDDDIIETLEAALEELGVNIRVTGNGNEAVRMVEEKVPDLMILDQMLPGRSGFIILENIRAFRKETGKPPIIMITANPGSRHKVYAETLGVDCYLNKPFRMERFMDAVKDLLSRSDNN